MIFLSQYEAQVLHSYYKKESSPTSTDLKMTKGNWERRAEMSLIRRTEAKEKKASRNDTTKIKPESVLQKLHRDQELALSGVRVDVYLSDPSEHMICKCYMRRDDCRIKKCKLPHDGVTVAHLKNVPYTVNTDIHALRESEKTSLPPVPLDEVAAKESGRIMFISVDGSCIYDYLHPEVWHQWIALHQPIILDSDECASSIAKTEKSTHCPFGASSGTSGTDNAVSEEIESKSDVEDISDERGGREELALIGSSSSKPVFFVSEGEGKVASKIFTFLSDEDVISLLCCSKVTKSMCLKDEVVRQRKKEAISLLSHDLSKKKKEEKRKKAKNACISKVDKKDAFARGATIR